jgi:hypothetical protein
MGYYTIRLDQNAIQKSVPSSFLGASILPQVFTMETAGSPDITIVGANEILRGCMSSPQ